MDAILHVGAKEKSLANLKAETGFNEFKLMFHRYNYNKYTLVVCFN